jgi:hypothetical protein
MRFSTSRIIHASFPIPAKTITLPKPWALNISNQSILATGISREHLAVGGTRLKLKYLGKAFYRARQNPGCGLTVKVVLSVGPVSAHKLCSATYIPLGPSGLSLKSTS